MKYNVEGLNDLSKQFHQFQIDAGFTDSNITQRLMLVHSEISEAFEAFHKDEYANLEAYKNHLITQSFETSFCEWIKDSFEDEIADAVIRLLAMCAENNIDIEKHIQLTMKYNQTRGFKFGG